MARLLAFALLGLASWLASAQPPGAGEFLYVVRIDPQGRVLTIEPQVDPRIAALPAATEADVRRALVAGTYRRGDDRGGTLTTWLSGSAAIGADAAAPVAIVRTGPRPLRLDPPHSPSALVRERIEADLLLRVAVTKDGKTTIAAIDGLETLGRERAQRLREKITHVAKSWRFQPERWDGRPIDSTTQIALQYRIERGDDTDWQWRGPALAQAASVVVASERFVPWTLRLAAKLR
jgi:hypothetical protein